MEPSAEELSQIDNLEAANNWAGVGEDGPSTLHWEDQPKFEISSLLPATCGTQWWLGRRVRVPQKPTALYLSGIFQLWIWHG